MNFSSFDAQKVNGSMGNILKTISLGSYINENIVYWSKIVS